MQKTTSRRIFMRKTAFAISGLTVLTPSLINAFNPENPFIGYNPYAENHTDLRCGSYNDTAIIVKGTVYNKEATKSIANALLEVWHLSPNSSKYRHRAQLMTDAAGNYQFITDFPNREPGKSARIYFKVSREGKTEFSELLLNNNGAHITSKHWENHRQLGDMLFPSKENILNQTTINFNISI